jgi:hypothetical protein
MSHNGASTNDATFADFNALDNHSASTDECATPKFYGARNNRTR